MPECGVLVAAGRRLYPVCGAAWCRKEVCGGHEVVNVRLWWCAFFVRIKNAGTIAMFAKTPFFPHCSAPKGIPLKPVRCRSDFCQVFAI